MESFWFCEVQKLGNSGQNKVGQGRSWHPDWSWQPGHPDGIRQGRFEYITDLRGLVQGGSSGAFCWCVAGETATVIVGSGLFWGIMC